MVGLAGVIFIFLFSLAGASVCANVSKSKRDAALLYAWEARFLTRTLFYKMVRVALLLEIRRSFSGLWAIMPGRAQNWGVTRAYRAFAERGWALPGLGGAR